jgi:hypothetical protein
MVVHHGKPVVSAEGRSMRRLALALTALLVSTVLGWTVATWAVAANSRAWFEQGLARSQKLLRNLAPWGIEIRAQLDSFEEGTRSSRARTSWRVGTDANARPLPLIHEITHGPNWSPADGFQIWRVETRVDRERLAPEDREWLEQACAAADPLVIELATADGRTLTGRATVAAGRWQAGGQAYELSGGSLVLSLTTDADGSIRGELQGRFAGLTGVEADSGATLHLSPFDLGLSFDLAEPCPGGWLSGRSQLTVSGLTLEGREGEDWLLVDVGTVRIDALAEAPADRQGRTKLRLDARLQRLADRTVAFDGLGVLASLALEPLSRAAALRMCELAALNSRPEVPPAEQEAAASALLATLGEGPSGLRVGIEVTEEGVPPHRLAAEITWPGGPRPATLGELAQRLLGRLELDLGLDRAQSPDLQQLLVLPVALGLARLDGTRVRGDVRLADGVLLLPAGPKPLAELLGPFMEVPLGTRTKPAGQPRP